MEWTEWRGAANDCLRAVRSQEWMEWTEWREWREAANDCLRAVRSQEVMEQKLEWMEE